MFESNVYIQRRDQLKKDVGSGIILFLGNVESPMNYSANPFRFRQDSSFLYFWGIDDPGLAGLIDIDEDADIIYGADLSIDDIVWTGPQPTVKEKGAAIGVSESAPLTKLHDTIKTALGNGRKIHFLPQYKAENILTMSDLLEIPEGQLNTNVSVELIKAVVAQRSIKSDEEIRQIELALDIAYKMHTTAMKMTKPGMIEREVAGAIEGIALAEGCGTSFPVIFSIHGETLHNPFHENMMKDGDIVVNDSGAESPMHYASDITRTIPVSGSFSAKQKTIYEIVLNAQLKAINAIKPGVKYRDVHLIAVTAIAQGLNEIGLMSGNVDDAVEQGAHALFMPHGVGHMIGLDVHDMEGLGENYVGYDDEAQRSDQFGTAYLRLGKRLKPGYVVTVEPGIYFIPELIDQWKTGKKFTEFINYDTVDEYRDFGGIRIEDNVLVTETENRVLGKPIPKTVDEVETTCSG